MEDDSARGLSIFYLLAMPSPGAIAAGAATVLLLAVLALHPRVRPAVRVGSLWSLVTLIPVSGLVRIGEQLVADRYSYLPTIGLLIAAVFGPRSFVRGAPRSFRNAAAAAAVAVVTAFAVNAAVDCRRFRNGLSLFSSALEVDSGSWLAQAKVGTSSCGSGGPARRLPGMPRRFGSDPSASRRGVEAPGRALADQSPRFSYASSRFFRLISAPPTPSIVRMRAWTRVL